MDTPQTKHWDSVDLCKFILSLMVVLIHVKPFPGALYDWSIPVLRCAVPLFFLFSSFFFFRSVPRHLPAAGPEAWGRLLQRLVRFTKRNLVLYLFWLIVLLVPTLYLRQWFADGLLLGLFKMANAFLFHSTFIVSWFIMALVLGTWIVALLSLRLPTKAILALSLPLYAVCALLSNYYYAPLTQLNLTALDYAFHDPYRSFWVAIFWVALGKLFAEHEQQVLGLSRKALLGALAGGLALIYLEQAFVLSRGFAAASDVFFALPLVCAPVFLLVLKSNATFAHAAFWRASSTIIYCLHDTFKGCLIVACGLAGVELSNLAILFIVAPFCLGCSWAILKLESKPRLAWLRFSH